MSGYLTCVSIPSPITSAQIQQGSSHIEAKSKKRKELKDGGLPPELDFFKYATTGALKRKPSGPGGEVKRRRKEETASGSDADAEAEGDDDGSITTKPSDDSRMPRHRVTIKGENAPGRVDTFGELRDRYHIPSQLMDNLKRYGYEDPTGIQAAGCPILLEVSGSII